MNLKFKRIEYYSWRLIIQFSKRGLKKEDEEVNSKRFIRDSKEKLDWEGPEIEKEEM